MNKLYSNSGEFLGVSESLPIIRAFRCERCGCLIREEDGVTCHGGEWVCDRDTCRTLDSITNESYIKQGEYEAKASLRVNERQHNSDERR